QQAWNGGAQDALRRLIELLVADKKFDELAKLDNFQNARTRRILAETFLQAGQNALSQQFVEKAAEIDADTLEATNWQAQMYVRLKQGAKAESILKAYADRHKTELDPWLSLLTIQAVHKKPEAIKATLAEIKANVKADNPKLLDARCARAVGDVSAAANAYRAAVESF
ncbi:unnamed protein product, partial [Phaeothamnion confervicola]